MALFALVFKSTFRNRLRALLTSLGVAVAIVAFLQLRTLIHTWNESSDAAVADRMVIRNKISTTFPLTQAHVAKVRGVPGVLDVSWSTWFAGVYLDERQHFPQIAVDPESYYRLHPELRLSPEELRAWLADRTGAVAGDKLVEKYGWKIGDRIVLKGTVYPGDWELTLRGIYTADGKNDRDQLQFNWRYLNEQVEEGRREQVGIILAKVSSPDVGMKIDKLFESSIAETRSESEQAYRREFLSMTTAVLSAVEVVSAVVLVILLLILGNTMAMASRERTSEYGVMRAIGFRPRHIVGLLLGEGFLIAALGAGVGVIVASPLLRAFTDLADERMGGILGNFELAPKLAAMAMAVTVAGGMLAAAVPAWRAGRLPIIDALRRIE